MLRCLADSGLVYEDFCNSVELTDKGRAVVEEIYSEYNEIYIFFKRILRLPDPEAKEQTLLFINTFPKSTGERLSEVVKKSLNKKNNKE